MTAQIHMLITTDKRIVFVSKKKRNKYWLIHCGCPKRLRRVDGSCKHERGTLEMLKPKIRKVAKIDTRHKA